MKHRVIAFPVDGIAYNEGLYAAFAAQGAEVRAGEWAGRWLLSNVRHGDVVHIHWPSFLYEPRGSIWAILKSFLRFLLLMGLVRSRTREIWWTAHNLLPHVRCRLPRLDLLARAVVIRLARRVFVHGPEAEKILLDRFPAAVGKSVLIPHGNWIGYYPPRASRAAARSELGLPADAFVYLFFGQCKPYKNLESLIEVFRGVAKSDDMLLVAGGFSDPAYLAKVLELAAGDARIRIDHGFIPDDKVSAYLVACNAMCMPYREILTSGTTMLALSYGRPVLSINRGFLRDVVGPDCGLLIEPGSPEALARALGELRARSWCEADILKVAERFSFAEAAEISLAGL